MNYKKYYNLLIERARNRTLDCYVEKHHIIPKCMDGNNSVNARKENVSTMLDYLWYNNGEIHKRNKNGAPDGFILGRIFKKRNRSKNA